MNELLDVRGLGVTYPAGWRKRVTVLDEVSFTIGAGETLGLVGESGSGKTTIGRAILGLAPVTTGSIRFDGDDLAHVSKARRRELARSIQVVFQDPYTSLNPSMTVEDILVEPLTVQGRSAADARRTVRELLDRVHLPTDAARRLPREFSGGQRQRIAIARAIAIGPRLIVCDEPVSALDLTTQATVLDLLIEIQQNTDVAFLFISHDLTVVRHISHRVIVLNRGRIVEEGTADVVTSAPAHPYTQRLLMSAPVPDVAAQRARREARRALPDLSDLPDLPAATA
jgi:ABC-type glutathione transport system ATPase component